MSVRSNGPDKLKNKFACFAHHNGERSFSHYNSTVVNTGQKMLMDYECCCDTCMYYKPDFGLSTYWSAEGESNPSGIEHCCACNPKFIVATWDRDNVSDACSVNSQQAILSYSNYYPNASATLGVKYVGSIVNHEIAIYLSPFAIDPDDVSTIDNSGCRWTMHISNGQNFYDGYTTVTAPIDHNDITCLGVPDFAISGISGFEGDGGTVSLLDYDSRKVPFVRRDDEFVITPINTISNSGSLSYPYRWIEASETYSPAQTGIIVTLPTGIVAPPYIAPGYSGGPTNPLGNPWIDGMSPTGIIPLISDVTEVPRFLCVESYFVDERYAQYYDDTVRFREYEYDSGFYPIQRMEYHPSYTGIEHFTIGNVLAKWKYTPIGLGESGQIPANENEKQIYLYESYSESVAEYSGDMSLVTASGSPRYKFILSENDDGDPDIRADHVWDGAAYYTHPAINFTDFDGPNALTGGPQLVLDTEDYYWVPSGDESSRSMYLGGGKTIGAFTLGSGDSYSCDTRSFGYYDNLTLPITNSVYIRPGRCSCWKYLCSSRCRCVPKNICLYTYEYIREPLGTDVQSHNLTWDGSSCWTANSGEVNSVSLCLSPSNKGFVGHETYNGACSAQLSGGLFSTGVYSYEFDPVVPSVCNPLVFEYSNQDGIVVDGTGVAGMYVGTRPNFSECGVRIQCNTASPCYINCGSHPASLNYSINMYSVSGEDEISGGYTPPDVYSTSFTLNYAERFILETTDPFSYYTLCLYEGYAACGSGIVHIESYLGADGTLPFLSWNTESQDDGLYAPFSRTAFDPNGGSYTESCDPYEFSGLVRETAPFYPFWECPRGGAGGEGAFRMEISITE